MISVRLFLASTLVLASVACTSQDKDSKETSNSKSVKTSHAKKAGPAAKSKAPKTAIAVAKQPNLLLGRWTMDLVGFKMLDEYKSLSAAQQKSALALFEQMEMNLTFTDTEIRMTGHFMGQKKSKVKPYSIIKSNRGMYRIETASDDGVKISQEVTVNGDTMKVSEGQRVIALKRVK
jgi:hypothetical protein